MSSIHRFPDPDSLAIGAAEQLIELAKSAITEHGRFSIALSGGSTPRSLYELLATPAYAGCINWQQVHVFWGDERCVPPDHVDSCYRMAREALLDHVPIPPGNIQRILGERPPNEAADQYELVLQTFFGQQSPRFDLILLGMGDDGHTASLFPGTKALDEKSRWVIENYVEVKQMWRVTLTKTAINAAANVIFLVSGSAKAERLRLVLQGTYDPQNLPSQLIKPENGKLMWFVDQDAAHLLT
jgi:6-phosphogluconolactonase